MDEEKRREVNILKGIASHMILLKSRFSFFLTVYFLLLAQ